MEFVLPVQQNALLSAVRSNLAIHAFPALDFWRAAEEEEEELLFRQMNAILETVLMKHLPDLPRSPECEEHEARFAERLSEVTHGTVIQTSDTVIKTSEAQ